VEHKKVEFPQAAFGIIGLETSFAVANTALKGRMSLRRIVDRFCAGPRAVLGLPVPHIVEGSVAEITLFDPAVDRMLREEDLVSRSHNTPFIGQHLVGRPVGIIAQGRVVLDLSTADGPLLV
jgi:dihydroorotase